MSIQEKVDRWQNKGRAQAEEGVALGAIGEVPARYRKAYLAGYRAGVPATPEWAEIKAAQIERLNKSFYA